MKKIMFLVLCCVLVSGCEHFVIFSSKEEPISYLPFEDIAEPEKRYRDCSFIIEEKKVNISFDHLNGTIINPDYMIDSIRATGDKLKRGDKKPVMNYS